MTEAWKPALGYEEFYLVSDLGRAVRIKNQGPAARSNWKPVKAHPINSGYVRFCFCIDNSRVFYAAHRAVWEAFNGPIPEGMQINHLNGVKTDNRLCNLEVCSQSQNLQHAYRVLKVPAPNNPSHGSKNGRAKLTETDIPKIRELIIGGDPDKEIATKFNVSPAMIWMIRTGRNWRHV